MLQTTLRKSTLSLLRNRGRTHFSNLKSRRFAEAATDSSKVNFNFYLPHEAIRRSDPVDMVLVPAAGGVMGILPQHVPTVAQLRAGAVEVHNGEEKSMYFVSSGFCFVHKDRTDLCAVEAAKLEDFDVDAVRKGLMECEQKEKDAKDEVERAEAQIGVDLYTALQNALKK